jgi:biotin operon repressor
MARAKVEEAIKKLEAAGLKITAAILREKLAEVTR